MKPIIKENEAIHYVSQSDLMMFISKNEDGVDLNSIVDDANNNIFNYERNVYFHEKPVDVDSYNEYLVKWVGAFFDAHPFMNKIYFVFDD